MHNFIVGDWKKKLNLFTCILDPSTEHYICIF